MLTVLVLIYIIFIIEHGLVIRDESEIGQEPSVPGQREEDMVVEKEKFTGNQVNRSLVLEEIVDGTRLHCDAVGEIQCGFCGSFETITIRDVDKGDGYICLPCNNTSIVGTVANQMST